MAIAEQIFGKEVFFSETMSMIDLDLVKNQSRSNYQYSNLSPEYDKLQLGCGGNLLDGWLNIDLTESDFNLDLSCGKELPWKENSFKYVAARHFIEHLHLETELIPLLRNVYRVCAPDAVIWLSCPDIEKICSSYLSYKCADLYENRRRRYPSWNMGQMPVQHFINELFNQGGEHKNLFDFELLSWALESSGFQSISKHDEMTFLSELPDFPPRNDDDVSLYVRAIAKK